MVPAVFSAPDRMIHTAVSPPLVTKSLMDASSPPDAEVLKLNAAPELFVIFAVIAAPPKPTRTSVDPAVAAWLRLTLNAAAPLTTLHGVVAIRLAIKIRPRMPRTG